MQVNYFNSPSRQRVPELSAAVINALGDSSISGQSQYQENSPSLATVPAWLPSTGYILGNVVKNGGLAYYCRTAGTSAGSGGPTTTSNNITDGTAHWTYLYPRAIKQNSSILQQVEALSLGRLNFDMSQGYGGLYGTLINIIVISGGSGYTAPTLTLNNGATATVQTSGGVITGYTITNPGEGVVAAELYSGTLSDATGTGATFSLVMGGSGTFAANGSITADMVARLPDVIASKADIIVVWGGAHECTSSTVTTANLGTLYTTMTSNLRTCYERLALGGKKVIAMPLMPNSFLTGLQIYLQERVNNWIRAYCRKESWANPLGIAGVVLADPARYIADASSTGIEPIGGTGALAGAMTQDGEVPSARGAAYIAMSIIKAAQQWIGLPDSAARVASMADGFDLTLNPGGNCIEAFPWQASYAYFVGETASNGGKIYRVKTAGAGTSASSGGPTGTGGTITDGGVTWAYVRPTGASVFASGTVSLPGSAGSVTCSGLLDASYTFARAAGTAAGTIVGAIENPWSDGQVGKRQVLTFSLGSGSNNEAWSMNINNFSPQNYGVPTSDYGTGLYYLEAELELSSIANVIQIELNFNDADLSAAAYKSISGNLLTVGSTSHLTIMSDTNEMLPLPNNGKIYLRTQPLAFPSNLNSFAPYITCFFDASGAAGSATLVAKINYLGMRRWGSA